MFVIPSQMFESNSCWPMFENIPATWLQFKLFIQRQHFKLQLTQFTLDGSQTTNLSFFHSALSWSRSKFGSWTEKTIINWELKNKQTINLKCNWRFVHRSRNAWCDCGNLQQTEGFLNFFRFNFFSLRIFFKASWLPTSFDLKHLCFRDMQWNKTIVAFQITTTFLENKHYPS